jgi:hypothetical protein
VITATAAAAAWLLVDCCAHRLRCQTAGLLMMLAQQQQEHNADAVRLLGVVVWYMGMQHRCDLDVPTAWPPLFVMIDITHWWYCLRASGGV